MTLSDLQCLIINYLLILHRDRANQAPELCVIDTPACILLAPSCDETRHTPTRDVPRHRKWLHPARIRGAVHFQIPACSLAETIGVSGGCARRVAVRLYVISCRGRAEVWQRQDAGRRRIKFISRAERDLSVPGQRRPSRLQQLDMLRIAASEVTNKLCVKTLLLCNCV